MFFFRALTFAITSAIYNLNQFAPHKLRKFLPEFRSEPFVTYSNTKVARCPDETCTIYTLDGAPICRFGWFRYVQIVTKRVHFFAVLAFDISCDSLKVVELR